MAGAPHPNLHRCLHLCDELALRRVINQFAQQCQGAPADASVLFYYTGHGMQVEADECKLCMDGPAHRLVRMGKLTALESETSRIEAIWLVYRITDASRLLTLCLLASPSILIGQMTGPS